MKIGFFGLGRMGAGMVGRVVQSGHEVVGYDINTFDGAEAKFGSNFKLATSIDELLSQLQAEPVTIVWLMVPAGEITNSCVSNLIQKLPANSILVDGGNSNFNDSKRNYLSAKEKRIRFIDVGTSGGVWGLKNGFCLMVGGDKSAFDILEPIFAALGQKNSYSYVGESGAGHYAKMVHNAIEYALMQSYGEGIDLLENGPYEYDLKNVVSIWNQGSVIRSWLLELGEKMLSEDPKLNTITGEIADSGTGRWSVEEALKSGIPIPLISTAVFNRFRSKRENSLSDRFIAGLRKAFGGHAVVGKK